MQYIPVILLMALVFGLCFLVDKGFTKLFRSRQQHKSGLAVRLSKRNGTMGLVLLLIGLAALLTGIGGEKILLIAGVVLMIAGAGLIIYYLSYGIFYDEDTFLQSSFGKKNRVCRFSDIRGQRLYVIQGGSVLVELHMTDGTAVGIQSTMDGASQFLSHAFCAWCRQTGRDPADCDFHDPAENQWFPTMEEI